LFILVDTIRTLKVAERIADLFESYK